MKHTHWRYENKILNLTTGQITEFRGDRISSSPPPTSMAPRKMYVRQVEGNKPSVSMAKRHVREAKLACINVDKKAFFRKQEEIIKALEVSHG